MLLMYEVGCIDATTEPLSPTGNGFFYAFAVSGAVALLFSPVIKSEISR